MRCVNCGKSNPDSYVFCVSCRRPLAGYSVAGGGDATQSVAYEAVPLAHAGFWLRFIAAIIDFIVLALLVGVVASFTSLAMGTWMGFLALKPGETPAEVTSAFGPKAILIFLVTFVIGGWFYFSVMECSRYQGTVGKVLVGLRVSDAQGYPVSFFRATARYVGGRLLFAVPQIGFYYLLLDCICSAFTPNKQAIHDMFSGCFVLRKSMHT